MTCRSHDVSAYFGINYEEFSNVFNYYTKTVHLKLSWCVRWVFCCYWWTLTAIQVSQLSCLSIHITSCPSVCPFSFLSLFPYVTSISISASYVMFMSRWQFKLELEVCFRCSYSTVWLSAVCLIYLVNKLHKFQHMWGTINRWLRNKSKRKLS